MMMMMMASFFRLSTCTSVLFFMSRDGNETRESKEEKHDVTFRENAFRPFHRSSTFWRLFKSLAAFGAFSFKKKKKKIIKKSSRSLPFRDCTDSRKKSRRACAPSRSPWKKKTSLFVYSHKYLALRVEHTTHTFTREHTRRAEQKKRRETVLFPNKTYARAKRERERRRKRLKERRF